MKRVIIYLLPLLCMFVTISLKAQSLKDAERFLRNEQYEDAESLLKKLVELKPKDFKASYLLGQTYIIKKNYELAQTTFQNGLTNSPKCLINQVGLGTVKLIKGDETGAKSDFDFALLKSKSKLKPELNREIGRAFITKGGIVDEDLQASYGKSAIDYITAAKQEDLDFNTELLLGDAYMLTIKTDAGKPVNQYLVAKNLDPTNPLPIIKLADLWRQTGNLEQAKNYAQQAINLDKDFAPAYRTYAVILSENKENDLALDNFKEYLKRNNNPSAKRQFVSSLYLNGKYNESIDEGKKLLTTNPDFNNIYGVIALAHIAEDSNDLTYNQNGLSYFEQWETKEFTKNNKQLGQFELFQKAKLLNKVGQKEVANGLFLESIKDTAKTKPELMQNVASILLANENYDGFIKVTNQKIAKVGVSTLNDKINLGIANTRLGNFDAALTQYKGILNKDSSQIGAYSLIGRTYLLSDTNDVAGLSENNYTTWISKLKPEDKIKKAGEIKNIYSQLAGAAQRRKDWTNMLRLFKQINVIDPTDTKVTGIIANLEKYLAKINVKPKG